MIHQICRRLAIASLSAASVAVPPLPAQSAEPPWYTFCVGSVGGRADLYLSDIFPMSRDALAGLTVQKTFKDFLQDRYAKPRNTIANNVSCLTNRFPKEEQVRRRKDDQISNFAQFHKEPGAGTIIETHWTPAGAPTDETAPAPSVASSAPPPSQPTPPSGTGSAEPAIYTFCYAQSGNTIYVSDIFSAAPDAPDRIAMTYRQLVSDQYQRPLRSISFGCDHTGLTSESQARDRKASTITNMQSNPAYTNLGPRCRRRRRPPPRPLTSAWTACRRRPAKRSSTKQRRTRHIANPTPRSRINTIAPATPGSCSPRGWTQARKSAVQRVAVL
jgi:hypothetical protein